MWTRINSEMNVFCLIYWLNVCILSSAHWVKSIYIACVVINIIEGLPLHVHSLDKNSTNDPVLQRNRVSSNSSLPGKMSAISQLAFSNAFFIKEKFCILIWISLEFVPKGPIHYKSTLVWVLAWCQIGDKPLPEPMLIQFNDSYVALGGDELNSWVP